MCAPCRKAKRSCEWPSAHNERRSITRRANATACNACRAKKLRCVGRVEAACEACINSAIECIRPLQGTASSTESPCEILISPNVSDTGDVFASPLTFHNNTTISEALSPVSSFDTAREPHSPRVYERHVTDAPAPAAGNHLQQHDILGDEPQGQELRDLVDLYFRSVHHFGYFAFIHELHFKRLLNKGKAPRELALIMIASAMRFAAHPSRQDLTKADAWADRAVAAVLPRIYQGFGAIQLMILLLAQHYDLNRGNFSSAWLLGANCTRMMQMMSLHTFERTYSPKVVSMLQRSPLLSCEALRRAAWATFYVDTIVDGGRYGYHIVDEKGYRLQLPCDEALFLGNEDVTTELLFPDPSRKAENSECVPLDMSAYLIRTAAARRRAIHFAFRASHAEQPAEELSSDLVVLEADMQAVIAALPRRFHFNSDNVVLHRDRLITFLLLHILRHNLFIIIGRAALQIYPRDYTKVELIPQVRRNRISHALPIAGLILEGLKLDISFDPQVGVQAYVALESMIFRVIHLT